jgi:flagellar biosynthesis protein FliR
MYEFKTVIDMLIAVLLAVAGGLARLLNTKSKSRLKWSLILSELFVSGFAGIMVLMLARAFGLSGDWIGLACGMAGWVGPKILNYVAKPVLEKIGIDEKQIEADSKEKK